MSEAKEPFSSFCPKDNFACCRAHPIFKAVIIKGVSGDCFDPTKCPALKDKSFPIYVSYLHWVNVNVKETYILLSNTQ